MNRLSSRALFYFSLTLLALITCVVLFWSMPASLMDLMLSGSSKGAIRLAQPRGRFLEGSGQVQLFADRLGSDFSGSPRGYPGKKEPLPIVLINNLSWKLSFGWSFSGPHIYLGLNSNQVGGSLAKVPLVLSSNSLVLPAGFYKLSEVDLSGFPAALGITRPQFGMVLTWPDTTINFKTRALFTDAVWLLDLLDVSTALSPIRPLGSYRVELNLADRNWVLKSIGSPVLLLSGQGHFGSQQRAFIEMKCTRSCEFVSSLMATLGKRNGEVYEIRIGSRV